MRHLSKMRLTAPAILLILMASSARAEDARPSHDCMNATDIREAVSAHKLVEPMNAVRTAVRLTRAEPLRSQLCRSKDGYQYELTLLRRDGKVIRLTMNAASGALISSRLPPERVKAAEERAKPPASIDRPRTPQAPAVRPKTAAER